MAVSGSGHAPQRCDDISLRERGWGGVGSRGAAQGGVGVGEGGESGRVPTLLLEVKRYQQDGMSICEELGQEFDLKWTMFG